MIIEEQKNRLSLKTPKRQIQCPKGQQHPPKEQDLLEWLCVKAKG